MLHPVKQENQRPLWSSLPVSGDGVSRTDPRTWNAASEIQSVVDAKLRSRSTERESAFPEAAARAIKTQQDEVNRKFGTVLRSLRSGTTTKGDGKKRKTKRAKRKSGCDEEDAIKELQQVVVAAFDDVYGQCMEWARVFEDLYLKQDELDAQMVKLTQRFWMRCPEYGYPSSPGLEGSVYSIHPHAAREWSKNVRDIEATRQKKAGVPKGALSKKGAPLRVGESRESVNLVISTATKKEQHVTRIVQGGLSEIPDAMPRWENAGQHQENAGQRWESGSQKDSK
jgi:hypothetical protein